MPAAAALAAAAQSDGSHVSLLLGITSNDSNVARRMLLRRTWLPGCRALPGCDAYFLLRNPSTAAEERDSGDIIVLDPNRDDETLHFSRYNAPLLPWFRFAVRHFHHAFIAKVDDDALVVPQAVAADLAMHQPDLYGRFEFASYQRPARFVPSDMIHWGANYNWALNLAREDKPGLRRVGPFIFPKGPMVLASRRLVQQLTTGACLSNWEYRVKNKKRLDSLRLHDDVTFGLFAWHCLNGTRLRLLDLQPTSFVEFRRWHSYPPYRSAIRVVHLGYVLKPAHLGYALQLAQLRPHAAASPKAGDQAANEMILPATDGGAEGTGEVGSDFTPDRDVVDDGGAGATAMPIGWQRTRGRTPCPESVWSNLTRQPVASLFVSCASCAHAWDTERHVQPLWTCCQNAHPGLDLARPSGWVRDRACAIEL